LDKLTKLETLSLHNNRITTIEGLDKLTKLKWLYLFPNINSVNHDRDTINGILSGTLSPKQVLDIPDMDLRAEAYRRMDKRKMRELQDFRVLSKAKDGKTTMRVVEFRVDGYEEPFRYLNCFCPSTGRENYLETRQTDARKAKAASFGFDSVRFEEEW
jgi:hypothetical protein